MTAKRTLLVAACSTIALGLSGLAVESATASSALNYYVSPSGSDANDGLSPAASHAWRTIAHAAAALNVGAAGTTVHVADGTYPDAVRNDNDGTANGYVTFAADHPGRARIAYTGSDFPFKNTGDYVRISGFEITGPDSKEGIYVDADHDVIQGNHVHNIANNESSVPCAGSGGDGMGDPGSAVGNAFIGNTVHDVGRVGECPYIHGIYPSGAGDVIQNNIAYDNSGSGLRFNHGTSGAVITNNLTFHNRDHGISISGDDSGAIASGFVITNNIIVDNAKNGIYVNANANSAGNEYGHNLFHGNGGADFALSSGSGTWTPANAAGEVHADPGLVNFRDDGSGDYHLTATSPCVNAGTKTGAPADDIEGNPRPQGGYDIGPYEYGTTTTITSTGTTTTTTPTTTTIPPPGSVVAGFEDGTTQGWSGYYGNADPVVTTEVAWEGNHSLRFELSGSGHSAVGTARTIGAVQPGSTVVYHVYAAQPGTTVTPFARNKNFVATSVASVALPAEQWTTVTWTIPPMPDVGAIGLDAPAGSGTVAVDALTWPTS